MLELEEKFETYAERLASVLLEGTEENAKAAVEQSTYQVIAHVLNHNEEILVGHVFDWLDLEKAIETFENLDFERQLDLLNGWPLERVASLLNEVSPDDRTAFFQHLSDDQVKHWMSILNTEERRLATSLLRYPEESIGRLMTTDYISVQPDWTVEQTLAHIREHGMDSETLNVIYVTDDEGKLIDDFKIREVLLSPLNTKISELMDNQYVSLNAYDDQEISIRVFKETDRFVLPVTDFGGVLVGIVTSDDLLDVIESEDTEDIQKLGGSESFDEPYFKMPLLNMVKKRAGWLIILFIGEMLTATAMSFFEDEIAKAVILALFVPLIISSGGNTGSQAATIIIRAMALGELTLADWWKVMRREILTGLLLGAILGVIGFMRISIWTVFTDIYGVHWMLIAFTVAFSLVGVVLWGTITGSMLPILLKKLGADPAASSAPFVATLVDVTGLIIYFSFAVLFLRGTLL